MKKSIACLTSILALASCNKYSETELAELDRGMEVYITNCVSCHGVEGKGLNGAYPSLINSKINDGTSGRVFALIQNGSGYNGGMKPIPLSQSELKEVVNYIQNAWGNKAPFIDDKKLKKYLN